MRIRITINITCMLLCGITACTNSAEKKHETHAPIAKDTTKADTVYPFSKSKRVELLLYSDSRTDWDKHMNWPLISDWKIKSVVKKHTREKVSLEEKQIDTLYDILYSKCAEDRPPMKCYEPRHALVFYDSTDKAFAVIEICFECSGSLVTEGVKRFSLCNKKKERLESYFIRLED